MPVKHLPMRPGEVPNSVTRAAFPDKVLDLGIDPAEYVSLEEGVFRTVKWFDENWAMP